MYCKTYDAVGMVIHFEVELAPDSFRARDIPTVEESLDFILLVSGRVRWYPILIFTIQGLDGIINKLICISFRSLNWGRSSNWELSDHV